MEEMKKLYEDLDHDCRKAFRILYADRYGELWMYLNGKEPEEDELDELLELYLANLLEKPNDVTHYTWDTEVIRKRDRAAEAILSSPSKLQKQLEIDKAVRIWMQMAGWYMDFVSQDAEIQVYIKAGVKKVRRYEMNDTKVCDVCRKADGEIYDINKIPPLPHLRCRRWFEPVI